MPGMIKTGMNPIGTVSSATVAANVLDAMRRRRSYVFTDDHSTDEVAERLQRHPVGARRRHRLRRSVPVGSALGAPVTKTRCRLRATNSPGRPTRG